MKLGILKPVPWKGCILPDSLLAFRPAAWLFDPARGRAGGTLGECDYVGFSFCFVSLNHQELAMPLTLSVQLAGGKHCVI